MTETIDTTGTIATTAMTGMIGGTMTVGTVTETIVGIAVTDGEMGMVMAATNANVAR